ncbi:MAG: hypothetical protein H5T43_05540 [Methanomethylovorans sp.]|jgi:hypothetical protein|nr:hypothetical protein [Methanomethylovorans sp.]
MHNRLNLLFRVLLLSIVMIAEISSARAVDVVFIRTYGNDHFATNVAAAGN